MTEPSRFMKMALELAAGARGRTVSNPWVGAVLVRDGEVISRGATAPPGGDHAEAAALRNVDARGAELYVTLEPCVAFEGKRTPPCTDGVVSAGVARVVVAMADPDVRVAGRGVAALRAAGIQVETGDGFAAALQLQRPYLKHAQTRTPYVICKFAASLDGRIATASGESKWITSEAARDHAHRQRAWVDAVMVGSGTVLADDPSLTARPGGVISDHQPLRIVLDGRGRVPVTAKVFAQAGHAIVATSREAPRDWKKAIAATGAHVIECEAEATGVNLEQLLATLGERNVTSIWAEGGGALHASLLKQGLADEIWAYVAPIVIGADGVPAVGRLGVEGMFGALSLTGVEVERLGPDVLIRGNTDSWRPNLVAP